MDRGSLFAYCRLLAALALATPTLQAQADRAERLSEFTYELRRTVSGLRQELQ
jgi:hypothetical protein